MNYKITRKANKHTIPFILYTLEKIKGARKTFNDLQILDHMLTRGYIEKA